MDEKLLESTDEQALNRRSFLHAGTAAMALGATAAADPDEAARRRARRRQLEQGDGVAEAEAAGEAQWRNKQEGMAYRRLGRTEMMISEFVSGGDPITPENFRHLERALEMGLNYLDMAPAYNRGGTEMAYGQLLAAKPGRRDSVFLATKISPLKPLRESLYKAILEKLPGSKQEGLRARAAELREERGVDRPGYHLTYFPNQERSLADAYLRAAMFQDYGEQVESSPQIRKTIVESLEGSLKRVGTDHFDVLMCPHGADTIEDVMSPHVHEVFQSLKQQGKARFLGVTSHNEPAGVLRAAADTGWYDVVMMAYNVVNGGYVDGSIRLAESKDVGVIAMKVAMAVATHHKPLQPVPQWRINMVERIVPGDYKAPQKAYLWALQNPRISAVISNLWDETHVRENLSLAGKKVDFQPA